MHDPRLVVYHQSCLDGFTAAWIYHKKHPNAMFIPASHGSRPPEVEGKEVTIVDFAYKEQELLGIKSKAVSLKVLDHHASAADALKHLPFCFFDLQKCGARLAWEDVYGRKKAPWLIDYVEDVDLYRFSLPNTRAVNCYLSTIPHTFNDWEKLAKSQLKVAVEKGKILLKYREQLVLECVSRAREVWMGDHLVLVANCSCVSLSSDVANALAVGRPFGACYFVDAKGHKVWSLRSTDEGEDVGAISKAYGGGGHAHCAGFKSIA